VYAPEILAKVTLAAVLVRTVEAIGVSDGIRVFRSIRR
jgi:hypothetical protein